MQCVKVHDIGAKWVGGGYIVQKICKQMCGGWRSQSTRGRLQRPTAPKRPTICAGPRVWHALKVLITCQHKYYHPFGLPHGSMVDEEINNESLLGLITTVCSNRCSSAHLPCNLQRRCPPAVPLHTQRAPASTSFCPCGRHFNSSCCFSYGP